MASNSVWPIAETSIAGSAIGWTPPAGDDRALGLVDFSIFPHLDHELLPDNTFASAEKWAAGLDGPAYAIDDETAIRVVGGAVDVVSEGHWHRFEPEADPRDGRARDFRTSDRGLGNRPD